MLQSPMVLHQHSHQQIPSSFIDSRSSSTLHHHSRTHHLPPVSSCPSQLKSLSPLQSPRSGRVSSSEIETGVWTSTQIPADVTFGPYDGEFTLGCGMKDHRATPYMLEVKFVEGRLVSGPDAHPTRWMRFVSPSRKEHEHNLEADISSAAAQGGQSSSVIFRTTRPILKGEELLVWYSTRLADKDGVPLSVNRFKGKDGFTCSRCSSSFRYPNTLKAHMRYRCYTRDSVPTIDVRPLNGNHELADQDHSVCPSAFHRVSTSVSASTDSLYVANDCPLVAESPQSSILLARMDEHTRRRDSVCSGSSSATSPNGTLSSIFLSKIGSSSGSAFRPTGKVVGNIENAGDKKSKEKEGFRVVKKDSSTMGTSVGTPLITDSKQRARSASETEEERKGNPGVDFSMDKVLSMPRFGHPRTPGTALAYLQVQRALEKNYGLPTYDPVVSHAGSEIPVAIRSLQRGPLGLDPYTGYPYRFLPPPGFPVTRLPPVLPMHRHGEAFNGLHKFPYPGFLKFPPSSEPTVAPPALLTPPPEMDLSKYAALERNLTSQATPTFPIGDPQFAYSQNANGKNKKGHLCIYCGKLYSRKYGLKIHLRTHTGYKPLKCKVCLRPFGDPSNLNKHIRLHAEGDTPYRCDYCGKVLVRRRDLDRHIRSRHPTATECNKKNTEVSPAKELKELEEPEELTISVDDDEIDCVNDESMVEEDVRQS